MTITLKFEESEIPLLSDGLQSLPYKTVAPLITKLQAQINEQVVKKTDEQVPPEACLDVDPV